MADEPHICTVTEFEPGFGWRPESADDLEFPFRVACSVCAFASCLQDAELAFTAADHHYDLETRRAERRALLAKELAVA